MDKRGAERGGEGRGCREKRKKVEGIERVRETA